MTGRTRVAVLGAGRLGCTMSLLLQSGAADVRLWARAPATRKTAQGILNGLDVEVVSSLEEATAEAEVIVIAVPAEEFANVVKAYGVFARGDHCVLHATRGVGDDFVLPHEMLRQYTCIRKLGVLGGPLYSAGADGSHPVFVALASRYDEVWDLVRHMTKGTVARIHYGRDIIGTEVAGIYTLVTALAVGMADALGFTETSKGVLMAHGLSEATKLGLFLGGELSTFTGLAGLGDLIPRKVTSTERHYTVAAGLVAGKPIDDLLGRVVGHVEGVGTARHASRLLDKWGLDLPIMDCIRQVIDGTGDPRVLLENILRRDLQVGSELAPRVRR